MAARSWQLTPAVQSRWSLDTALANRWLLALVYACLAGLAIWIQTFSGGYLTSQFDLDIELRTTGANIWGLGRESPYCYRPLFRWIVLAIFQELPAQTGRTFHALFAISSAISLALALLLFHKLMRLWHFSRQQSLTACLLMLGSFPVIFCHDIPVHTREDFLGYTGICAGLIFITRDRPVLACITATVFAWVRETCLLGILPFFFISKRPLWQRVVIYLPPLLSVFILRTSQKVTGSDYSLLTLLRTGLSPTLDYPGEAALYMYAAFGVIWIAAAIALWRLRPQAPALSRVCVALAILAVGGTGWTLGMIRENRITFLLFPFLIPCAVQLFSTAWFRRALRCRAAWTAFSLVLIIGAASWAWMNRNPHRMDAVRKASIGYSFNPGLIHPLLRIDIRLPDGRIRALDLGTVNPEGSTHPYPLLASRFNGLHVLLHLAFSALLLVALLARKMPRDGTGDSYRQHFQ